MVIAAAPLIYFGPSPCIDCHSEGISCSTSPGVCCSWIKPPSEGHIFSDHSGTSFRCKNTFLGGTHLNWFPSGHESCLSKVSVASDYSDSVPSSSSYFDDQGYHPLEELKKSKKVRKTNLSSAEIAKTVVEANSSALLLFPGTVHCEPHEHVSWSQFRYVIDEYGDIFFEIPDDKNILEDCGASNPVNVLIGMHDPLFANRRPIAGEFSNSEISISADNYFELAEDSELVDMLPELGMSDSVSWVHPIYFSKCLTKAINVEHTRNMDHPSNGVSIVGWIRPAYIDEEVYIRLLFNGETSDGYSSSWQDNKLLKNAESGGNTDESTIYRLEMMSIEFTSVYGIQSAITLQDFGEAEADILVHSTAAIVEGFIERRIGSEFALAALCKKKGFDVEGANLIGVDSLGMDVRMISGTEVATHRFPFKVQAKSKAAAEKQIQQLLYPRSRRKRVGTHSDRLKDHHPL